MNVPEYLQLPDPVPSADDAIENNGYFPDLSQAEFEQNYQVTDVFSGKVRYMLQSAMIEVNNYLAATVVTPELQATYRMCVYARAMQMICERYTSIDTQTKSEFAQESKEKIAIAYANEYRRLLQVLNGEQCQVNCTLI